MTIRDVMNRKNDPTAFTNVYGNGTRNDRVKKPIPVASSRAGKRSSAYNKRVDLLYTHARRLKCNATIFTSEKQLRPFSYNARVDEPDKIVLCTALNCKRTGHLNAGGFFYDVSCLIAVFRWLLTRSLVAACNCARVHTYKRRSFRVWFVRVKNGEIYPCNGRAE